MFYPSHVVVILFTIFLHNNFFQRMTPVFKTSDLGNDYTTLMQFPFALLHIVVVSDCLINSISLYCIVSPYAMQPLQCQLLQTLVSLCTFSVLACLLIKATNILKNNSKVYLLEYLNLTHALTDIGQIFLHLKTNSKISVSLTSKSYHFSLAFV